MHFVILLLANLCIFQGCSYVRSRLEKLVLSVQTIACQLVGCLLCWGYNSAFVKLVQRMRDVAENSGSLTVAGRESMNTAYPTYMIAGPLFIVFLSFMVLQLSIIWREDRN